MKMTVKDAILSQLREITAQLNSDSQHKKLNAQSVLDNLLIIINNNSSDDYCQQNKDKLKAVLKMAQDQINNAK